MAWQLLKCWQVSTQPCVLYLNHCSYLLYGPCQPSLPLTSVYCFHVLQDSAASIKSKVTRIEDSQRRINDVRTTVDKVGDSWGCISFLCASLARVEFAYGIIPHGNKLLPSCVIIVICYAAYELPHKPLPQEKLIMNSLQDMTTVDILLCCAHHLLVYLPIHLNNATIHD